MLKQCNRNKVRSINVNRTVVHSNNLSNDNLEGGSFNYDNYGPFDKDLYLSKVVPISYKIAIKHSKWRDAIQKEINVWKKRNVFDLVTKTPSMKPVPVKWLLTEKKDKSCKARIVVIGNLDPEKYDKKDNLRPLLGRLLSNDSLLMQLEKGGI